VARERARNRTTVSTSVSLAAIETGVNSSTSMVEPKSAKNCPTASLPWRTPYHGAAFPAASAAQSTSSGTAARMAAQSPRPKASYTLMMVLVLASALMMKTPPRQRVFCHPGYVAGPAAGSPGGPGRHHGGMSEDVPLGTLLRRHRRAAGLTL